MLPFAVKIYQSFQLNFNISQKISVTTNNVIPSTRDYTKSVLHNVFHPSPEMILRYIIIKNLHSHIPLRSELAVNCAVNLQRKSFFLFKQLNEKDKVYAFKLFREIVPCVWCVTFSSDATNFLKVLVFSKSKKFAITSKWNGVERDGER